ncbi:endocuticle structural glycoprotein SgAbd-1 [Cephus cinctus]|uniref:Endocuticle structural glycoprotein SgAbd-1 n=1 Tax=Cephus cinctus TaxID=211228 RepID=A0AAJ7FRP1_CEPCN|nr:endocuticle structural glycoprotein SgAbd-1 [Cephus cinctus]
MKFLIVSLALVAATCAQYQQPTKPIAILRQAQDIAPDGSYSYNYDTENGISVAENGAPKPVGPKGEPAVVVSGQYQYPAPDGTVIQVTYSADENGFQPQGAHLPVAPPVPEAIQRSIAYNAAHPEENEYNPAAAPVYRRF